MNIKASLSMIGTACALGAVLCFSPRSAIAADAASSGASSQIADAPPSPAYVWMSGHWNSVGGQWQWVAAHWELPPARSAVWIAGHWAAVEGNWVWVNGAWNVTDAAQSPSAPPMPPAPGATLSNGALPTPSTPAPYISGSYGPGGVVRSEDFTSTPVEGAPDEYVASNPGYSYYSDYPYWAGDPWYWGFPGAYLGFGWGPVYYGGYHGWRGQGYWGHGGGHYGNPHGGGYAGGHYGNGAVGGRTNAASSGGHSSGQAGGNGQRH